MEGVDLVAVALRWLHLVSAVVTVGGSAFMWLALHPAAKESLDEQALAKLRESVRARWAKVVHGGIAMLLLTGFFNFYWLVLRADVPPMPYHALFGPKLLLALVVFFLASVMVGSAPGFAKWREAPGRPLKLIFVLAMVILLLTELLSQIRATGSGG